MFWHPRNSIRRIITISFSIQIDFHLIEETLVIMWYDGILDPPFQSLYRHVMA